MLLRDPVERVGSLYESRRKEFEARAWDLADVYLELGGGSPRSSELHGEFRDFFNGQTRHILAREEQSKLEFWAGIPDRGAALRDEALAVLACDHTVGVGSGKGLADPQTRSLILAYNQIDAELYAHFVGAMERDRPRPRRANRQKPVRPGGICVLGAPRSGTSLTARILNILGIDLGPEDGLMTPAADNNRTGFWEHEGIADLNEEIFAALAKTPPPYLQGWRWPPPLADGWEHEPRLEPYRRAARSILRGNFAAGPLWGWKDPRTCLTLPFWQQLVPEMRYVICVRHPLDVAASLAARDEMSPEESLPLWSRYMTSAMTHTEGKPRLFVSYESYFPGWEEQANRLAAFLGPPGLSEEQRDAIGAYVDGSLWHHRAVKEEQTELSTDCHSLYKALSELAQT